MNLKKILKSPKYIEKSFWNFNQAKSLFTRVPSKLGPEVFVIIYTTGNSDIVLTNNYIHIRNGDGSGELHFQKNI